MAFGVFCGSSGKSFALPKCEDSPLEITSPLDVSKWNNCLGSYIVGPTVSGFAGDKYIGEFKGGTHNGQGTYYYLADNEFKGNKYVGEFKNGKKHGQGIYTHADGNKYVGEYKNGKRNGQGAYTHADGDKYVGEFKNDKFHGRGTYYYLADNQFKGDKYVGGYKDGKMHGRGTYTYANGSKNVVEWQNGKLLNY